MNKRSPPAGEGDAKRSERNRGRVRSVVDRIQSVVGHRMGAQTPALGAEGMIRMG